MIRLLKILILFSFLACATNASADDDGSNIPLPLPKKEVPPLDPYKHKAPSLVRLYFTYNPQEKCATFELLSDIEYIDIEAENLESHIIYVGSVWAENPVWKQELPAGEYIITCTADNGDVYEGYVCL